MSSCFSFLISPVSTVIFSSLITIGSKYYDISLIKTGFFCSGMYLSLGFLGYHLFNKDKDESTKFLNILPIGYSFFKIFIFWSTLIAIHNTDEYIIPHLKNVIRFPF